MGSIEDFKHASGLSNGPENGCGEYQVREHPLNTKDRISVICVGAGVSGLATAIRVQETTTDVDFEIFEKNGDLGGTWLENRYPGCACKNLNLI